MKFRKKFSVFVIIGIGLLIIQIILDIRTHINCINSYDFCLSYFPEEYYCQCDIFTATGSHNLMYASNFISFVHGLAGFIGFNLFGIIGFLFIVFEKKKKLPIDDASPSKTENISETKTAKKVEVDIEKDDDKFIWE